jgi:hypothetical protein
MLSVVKMCVNSAIANVSLLHIKTKTRIITAINEVFIRVFGGGSTVTFWGKTYPSLMTCDEIKHDENIEIKY